jgi:hypothetical protein
MNTLIQFTRLIRNSTRRSLLRLAFLSIPLVLACFALSPRAQAVVPAPDGGYPGFNTAEGTDALLSRTTGVQDVALGASALRADTSGNFNTATGTNALRFNTIASFNTADGAYALYTNTMGASNTATGYFALYSNTTGSYNTATGVQALRFNTTGRRNVAEGNAALYSNVLGNFNVAVGDQALFSLAPANPNPGNTGGNTAIGWASMYSLESGGGNTALGLGALQNNTTGFQNVALGYVAGQNLTTGANNVYVSNPAVPTESNTIRIGNVVGFTDIYGFQHNAHTATFIAGIAGVTIANGITVAVDPTTGRLGQQAVSSQRFKDEIKPMDKASEAILALKPVTFCYKKEIDPKRTAQFGLVAEEVEKVDPDLITRGRDGKPYTVRYEAVNAMLLNEFLKEHQKVQKLEAALAAVNERLKEQDAKIDKVNAKVELTKPGPQVANNDQ